MSATVVQGQLRNRKQNACPPKAPKVLTRTVGGLIDSHLLRAPAGVGLAHVGGRLDGGDELEDDIDDADQADDRAGDDAQDAIVEEDGADEDVDCWPGC